ncbi:MAG: membrane protein insertase YidC [Streptococcaceae bacterium]|nr:membrane protein insertase YidC [Streptococcaceae bacterium]
MKKLKKIVLPFTALSLLFLLSGCVQYTKDKQPTGFVYEVIAKPMVHLIEFFASSVGYGWAIVLITIVVRIIIFPLGVSQSKKMMVQQEKMASLKPILEPIQKRLKNATTPEQKAQANMDIQRAYRENGVNMLGGIGCLPLLIQMPIFSALYVAARYTPGIQSSTFFGMALKDPSMILVVIVAVFYFVQGWASMIGVPEENKKQMQTMTYMSPIMMIFFTYSSPAGVGLYWAVGGIFALAQTLYTNLYLKPKVKAQIQEEMKKNPVKSGSLKDVTPLNENELKETVPSNQIETPSKGNIGNVAKSTGRNAGKQKKRY